MGSIDDSDVVTTVAAIERAFVASGYPLDLGAAVGAAEGALTRR
jgi:aspartate aminotransferase-like enzyme